MKERKKETNRIKKIIIENNLNPFISLFPFKIQSKFRINFEKQKVKKTILFLFSSYFSFLSFSGWL